MERVTSNESPSYGGDGHSSASDEDANPVEVNTSQPPVTLSVPHLPVQLTGPSARADR